MAEFKRTTIFLLGVALVQLGCVVEAEHSTADALAFNKKLTRIDQRLNEDAAPLLRPIILGWANGLEDSAASSNKEILQLLDQSIAAVEALTVPAIELAPELRGAVLEFFRKERAIFASDIAVLVDMLRDPMLSMDQKRLKVWEGLENAGIKSESSLRKVKQIQGDYAKRHGITLMTPPPVPIWNVD